MPPTRIGTAWLRPTAFTVDTALAFGCATPYCQASFSRETFLVLIWVSGEYRRPCGSPAYDGHPVDRDALCATSTAPAATARASAFNAGMAVRFSFCL